MLLWWCNFYFFMSLKKKGTNTKCTHTFQDIQIEVSSSECWLFCNSQWPQLARLWPLSEFGGRGGSGSRKFGSALQSGPVWRIDEAHQFINTGGWTQLLLHVWLWRRVLEDIRDTYPENTADVVNYHTNWILNSDSPKNTLKILFCGDETTKRKQRSNCEMHFACLWGIFVSSAEFMVHRWENTCAAEVQMDVRFIQIRQRKPSCCEKMRLDVELWIDASEQCLFQAECNFAATLVILTTRANKNVQQWWNND